MNKVLFSSQRDNWKTPKKFYKQLNKEFKFDFDPCPVNPKFDGLSVNWGKSNFVNPPYNKEIGKWLEKGRFYNSVFLLPARTDTKWFQEIVLPYADEIRFIKGRLKFDDQKNPAPFPSMLVIYKQRSELKRFKKIVKQLYDEKN